MERNTGSPSSCLTSTTKNMKSTKAVWWRAFFSCLSCLSWLRGNGEEHRPSKLLINLNHEKQEKHESGGVESLIFVYFVPFVVML